MNKTKIAILSVLVGIYSSGAFAITYVAAQAPNIYGNSDKSNTKLAREKSFYIGGGYTYSQWSGANENGNLIEGKNTSSFDVTLGARIVDTFRLEADYHNLSAKWNTGEITGGAGFINAIFDARVDGMYRGYSKQLFVPYVGLGVGMAFLSSTDMTMQYDLSLIHI